MGKNRPMNKKDLIDPSNSAASSEANTSKKKTIKKQKSDIIERKDIRVFTEDGKELLS